MQKLVNGELVDLTQEEIAARNAETTATEAKAITDHIKAYRRAKENGGITVSGVTVQTDTESRTNLNGAVALNTSIDWKTDAGFVTLTAAQISAIATAVGQHVQKCFSAEKAVTEAHAITPFPSKASIEEAFDVAYSN
jgi:hypothetical protein